MDRKESPLKASNMTMPGSLLIISKVEISPSTRFMIIMIVIRWHNDIMAQIFLQGKNVGIHLQLQLK